MRRLASMLYESLLLLAVVFLAGFPFASLATDNAGSLARAAFQFYLLLVMASYFCWFWTHGGQTLAMKTWRLRVLGKTGLSLTLPEALLRFVLAIPCVLLGVGILWALFDPDRQFLHDRLAGTRLTAADLLPPLQPPDHAKRCRQESNRREGGAE
jgi:uncharacterized RDD family membrane protein YckC